MKSQWTAFQRPAIDRKAVAMLTCPLARGPIERIVFAHRHLVPGDDLEDLIQDIHQARARCEPAHANDRRRGRDVRVPDVAGTEPRQDMERVRYPEICRREPDADLKPVGLGDLARTAFDQPVAPELDQIPIGRRPDRQQRQKIRLAGEREALLLLAPQERL